MGRFDSLKENTFNSNSNSNRDRDRVTDRVTDRDTNRVNRDSNRVNRDRDRDTNRVNNRDSNIFKEKKQEKGYANTKENFPDLIQEVTVNKNPNEGSIWLNAIKIKKEEEINKNKFIIDPNDSQYWRGGKWIGDMLLRQKQSIKNATATVPLKAHNNSSAFIIPNLGTEYSRDGINWYNSWNETFTEEELQRMEEEENKEMIQRWRDWIEDKYEQNRIESDRHYEETGELDGFALARLDRLAYEEYEKQFEMEEIEENDESDEYLEEED